MVITIDTSNAVTPTNTADRATIPILLLLLVMPALQSNNNNNSFDVGVIVAIILLIVVVVITIAEVVVKVIIAWRENEYKQSESVYYSTIDEKKIQRISKIKPKVVLVHIEINDEQVSKAKPQYMEVLKIAHSAVTDEVKIQDISLCYVS